MATWKLEGVEDVAEERARVLEQVDASVVERIRQAVAGTVDGEHAPMPGERRQDRNPLERAVSAAVHEQQR